MTSHKKMSMPLRGIVSCAGLAGPAVVGLAPVLEVLDVDYEGLPAGAELGASDIAHDGDGGLARGGGHHLSGAGVEALIVPYFDDVGGAVGHGGFTVAQEKVWGQG